MSAKEIKVYTRTEVVGDNDKNVFAMDITEFVAKYDHDRSISDKDLTIRKQNVEINLLKEQRNEAYRKQIETNYSGVSAIEVYEQTKYQAELQIEAKKAEVI